MEGARYCQEFRFGLTVRIPAFINLKLALFLFHLFLLFLLLPSIDI